MDWMPNPEASLATALTCLALVAGLSVRAGKMDLWGGVAGFAVGLGIYLGSGWPGLGLLLAFFLTGVGATVWRSDQKRRAGLLEGGQGQRGYANVLANGGVAAGLGLLALALPEQADRLTLMLAASLAAATSDTLSSEIGNVLGSRYYRITDGRRGRRGEDGIISPEGTLAGLLGAWLLGASYMVLFGADWRSGLLVAAAGFAGNLIDSLLGATWQRWAWIDNHGVNALNTGGAALLAGCLTGL